MSTLLELEPETFRRSFGRQPFLIRHRLAGHELFALPRLVELARRLPAASVEYNAGDVPLTLDPTRTPQTGLSVEETLRRIEECRSWMVLKNVEQDPEYRDLLELCLAEVHAFSDPLVSGMSDKEGFVFVSSPGSVTPYHLDPEQNFLLQIRGRKRMNVFDPADRALLSEEEIERFLAGAHRNLVYRDDYQAKAQVFELVPGLGVHVPVTAPHWVQNGDAVSVSFSITFQTQASMRRSHVHQMNADLRRWGFSPAPAGRSVLRDSMKQLVFRAKTRVSRALRRGAPPAARY